MKLYLANRGAALRALLSGAVAATLFACSSTDRSVDPITGLKVAPEGPRNAVITNGSIGVCKNAGPAGTYHFHVDVIGGGAYVLTPGADFSITFDGTDPSCISDIYKTIPPWAPGLTATVKISEVLLPPGVAVDSINATDRFGTIETSVVGGGTIVISEEVLGVHNANFYNVALPSVTCTAITGVAGVPITPVQLVGTGGSGGYTFTQTGLPAGLSMSSSGLITGTPTASGTTSYQVTVTDNTGHTGTSGSCAVTIGTPPTATCVEITGAVAGVAITPVTLTGSGGAGGPYTFSSSDLPAGLVISASGTISGTPTASGNFTYHITVKDKDGNSGEISCSVTVYPPPSANCVAIVGAVAGVPITPVTLTGSGGTGGPYTFSSSDLPAGLVISASGTISGTPTVTGNFNYTIIVKDKDGNSGSINCSVTINPPPPPSQWCEKAPVQTEFSPTGARFPGNTGPDVIVKVHQGQSVQTAINSATDSNGDGYIIIAVVAKDGGILGGSTTQSISINRTFPTPFALVGCSVTFNDPTPSDAQPTARVYAAASAPVDGSGENIFIMDVHASGSNVAGWLVEGDKRELRNVYGKNNAIGIKFVGNNNTMHNGSVENNTGSGLVVQGNSNLVTDTDVFGNQGNGVDVTGNNNQILKVDAGDIGKGNTGDGVHLTGYGNLIQEVDAFSNGGDGIDVTATAGAPNILLKNVAGDRGKGNLGNGIVVAGNGNGTASPIEIEQNTAKANTLIGIKVTGTGHQLKNNVSGGTGSGETNGGCEFNIVAGNVNATGNKANGTTVAGSSGSAFPTGCTGS